ncbi:L,D-transpeptidase [Paenibacillus mucilaginosus]|nr:L,D-transpeptidase [Paenibacillus mucilaginosus]MCG7217026.1 L,D-transpeptidase [Paenibacillus mucilaginosus]
MNNHRSQAPVRGPFCIGMLAVCLFLTVWGWTASASPVSAAAPAPGRAKVNDTPPPGLQEEGVYVVISKKTNRLTVYMNGAPYRTFPVATGRRSWLTPAGTFHIITKIKKPWYIRKQIPGGDPANPLGSRWMGLSVPGTGGYTYGIHGTNRPYSIGHSASSGCIRMHNRDIEWLYRHLPLGTVVIVKE